jgi:hypothetical protein
VGNHPDDRMQPEVISGEAMNAVWRWADAELSRAEVQEELRRAGIDVGPAVARVRAALKEAEPA